MDNPQPGHWGEHIEAAGQVVPRHAVAHRGPDLVASWPPQPRVGPQAQQRGEALCGSEQSQGTGLASLAGLQLGRQAGQPGRGSSREVWGRRARVAKCRGTAQEGTWAGIMLQAYEVTGEQGAILATEGDLQEREAGLCQVLRVGPHWSGACRGALGQGLQQAGEIPSPGNSDSSLHKGLNTPQASQGPQARLVATDGTTSNKMNMCRADRESSRDGASPDRGGTFEGQCSQDL